jgi:hypothetical protein
MHLPGQPSRRKGRRLIVIGTGGPEHDPEKWVPVSEKIMLQR